MIKARIIGNNQAEDNRGIPKNNSNYGDYVMLIYDNICWLVVWNIWINFPYIGNNHPNWRTHIFQRGRSTTNQYEDTTRFCRDFCEVSASRLVFPFLGKMMKQGLPLNSHGELENHHVLVRESPPPSRRYAGWGMQRRCPKGRVPKTSLWGSTWHRVSWGFLRFLEVSWGFLRFLKVSWGFLRFLEVSWGFFRFLRVSSGFFRFLQVSLPSMMPVVIGNFLDFRVCMLNARAVATRATGVHHIIFSRQRQICLFVSWPDI